MKIISTVTRWLFILCLPVLLLTASIAWAVNSLWLYEYGFEKYGVSQTTGIATSELEAAARGLISYFNSNEDAISLAVIKDGASFNLFNEREVAHLSDVKELIRLDYEVALVILLYILGYAAINLFRRKDWRQLARGTVGGSGLTLVLMLALGLGILLNFERLFWQFHLISFANDLWLLDPSRDYLIMLFPGGFWYDAVRFCALSTIVAAIILGGVAVGLLLINKKRLASQP